MSRRPRSLITPEPGLSIAATLALAMAVPGLLRSPSNRRTLGRPLTPEEQEANRIRLERSAWNKKVEEERRAKKAAKGKR
jgi:hypothetical protein